MTNGTSEPERERVSSSQGSTLLELVQRQTETATATTHHLHEMRRELGEQRAQLGTQSTHLGRLVELKEQERAEQAAVAAARLTEAQAEGDHRRRMHATIIERALLAAAGVAAAASAYWFGSTGSTP